MAAEPLTEDDENLLKDMLSELDRGHPIVRVLARQRSVPATAIMERVDAIWRKLNNGRLTVSSE